MRILMNHQWVINIKSCYILLIIEEIQIKILACLPSRITIWKKSERCLNEQRM